VARDRPEGWARRLGYAAAELLKLHTGRWEQELYCKELKVQIREGQSLQSRTNETETREVAALLIAGSPMVGERTRVAAMAKTGVLRIAFAKTFHWVLSLRTPISLDCQHERNQKANPQGFETNSHPRTAGS